jgi:hypothetical protein
LTRRRRARFPGRAVRQAVLLHYGDNPEIEPRDLWVWVLLDADGPEDHEPASRLASTKIEDTCAIRSCLLESN